MSGFAYDFTVVVVGGVGTYNVDHAGRIKIICIAPPSVNTVYDYNIVDLMGFGISGRPGLTGNCTIHEDVPCTLNNTFQILNASQDGSFVTRLYFL